MPILRGFKDSSGFIACLDLRLVIAFNCFETFWETLCNRSNLAGSLGAATEV